jgi:hypothetical protein
VSPCLGPSGHHRLHVIERSLAAQTILRVDWPVNAALSFIPRADWLATAAAWTIPSAYWLVNKAN